MACIWFATVLVGLAPAADAPKLSVRKYGDSYEFYQGTELVTAYHCESKYTKPILWPLNAPGQIGLTRDWPMSKAKAGESTDHIHQKSAWFAHGDVIPEGVSLPTRVRGINGVDFWSEEPGHGNIICQSVEIIPGERCRIEAKNIWKSPEGRPVVNESRSMELIAMGDARLIVVRIRLKPGSAPITFGDTKEGSFAVRVCDGLRVSQNPASKITLSTGVVGEENCWGQRADWCDYSGTVSNQAVGITLFDHPQNRARACWHVRASGLMSANPFGRRIAGFPAQSATPDPLVQLKPDEELRLTYGILLHRGDAQSGKMAEHFREFRALKE